VEFLCHAREVFHQIERARYEVDALTSGLSGRIAVGAVPTVLSVLAHELVLELQKRAPLVSVSFFEATSDRLFLMLASARRDIVLSGSEPLDGVTGFASRAAR
jgi:DNA-binding transcriptional LysR family regulator